MQSGSPFELQIVATFDARLSSVSFRLGASGAGEAYLTSRSADPNEGNGLTYVSLTSQDPFEDGLAHNFAIGAGHEALMDLDFGGVPGGPEDGLPAGTDVVVERVWITPTGTGSLTITLSDLRAVTTQGDPDGVFFDTVAIDANQVTVTVDPPAQHWLTTWVHKEDDGQIDLDPEPNDPNLPVFAAGTGVSLTAVPTGNKKLKHWRRYDPNHPGDANHFETDTNNPITVVMDTDQEVEARFKCGGSGVEEALPLLAVGLVLCAVVARRVRRRT